MRIAFNPSTVAALIAPPNNKDITFDLRGQNIFARGVKFCGTDTNTWRDIKINNVSIGSNILDLRDGDNTTLTNINGIVTINSTWRPVVDNLTSDSTTSSLSANQGRVLKSLINGKSDSDHNHDDRYLRLAGGWMSGDINFGSDNKICWGRNTDSASISFKNDGDGDADSYMSFVTSDNGNEYFRWSHSSGSTNTEWMALRSDGLRVGGTKVSLEGHTHDDRYVKKSGDTMTGVLTINTTNFGALTIKRNDDANYASIQFRGKSNVYGYIGLNSASKDKQFSRFNSEGSKIYTILDTSSTYVSNGKGIINGTTITQVDNATNSTNSTNARKLVNWYSARPTSLNAQFGDGSLRIFYATSSTTEGKPAEDSPILHLAWDNNGGWDTQLAVHTRSGKVSTRAQNSGTWQPWKTLAFTTDIPSSLKNPYALTISLNGTSQGPYDGSAAKNINITPSSIGAATSGHNHDGRYVYNYGGTQMDGASINKNALGMTTNSGITGDWWHILQAAWNSEYRWNSQIAFPTQNRNGMYYRSGLDDNTAWGAWVKLLDVNNYSSTLDSRYYTESEVDSLLDAKLNRQNLSYGAWNPRGYNLAADYYYNGGDLSISENDGKMYVSIDGQFYQNEGQYRVLDTSDISSIRGGLTLYQHLSATDATRYPLVWGGSDHKNTNNSTGSLYKSYDKLSWQTSSQTLYATNIQTENIKNLSVGGGIYWNPYVESTTDGSDAASITLVKSGVAGGTTLVLSQMNDANDTIQFKTNGSARLYHNSYPILTTQNTYVSNNKGYINGTEITQVNNADKVDNRHAISTTPNTGIIYKAAIYTSSSLTSYWVRLASIPSINQNNEFVATIHVQSGHSNPGRSAILLVYLRGTASSLSKSFKICCNSNYDPNRFRLYYKDSDKTSEIWYQTTGQWDGIITTVISQSSEGSLYEGLTLYSGSITAVQTPSMSTYLSAQVSTITDNISGNASTATKLQTSRLLWGQPFDGTADVTGVMTINPPTITDGKDNTIMFKVYSSTGYKNGFAISSTDNVTRLYAKPFGTGTKNALEIHTYNNTDVNAVTIDATGNVGIGTTSLAYKLNVNGKMRASGFIHNDYSINDAVLLAGGGYGRIFMMGTTRYYNNTSYDLSFHKLSGLFNNLVWVDGCIWNSTSTSFQLSSDFYPYLYANSPSMRTIYRMDGNNMITVDGNGKVVISCSSYPRRVGFFYTGRA